MERDPKISKLMKESGIIQAPDQFTHQVMEKIYIEQEQKVYKPIIGRAGRILIFFFILSIVVISIIYSEPGGLFMDNTRVIPDMEWKIPDIDFKLNFLQEVNIPTGILSAILALLILVLSDAGLKRRHLV